MNRSQKQVHSGAKHAGNRPATNRSRAHAKKRRRNSILPALLIALGAAALIPILARMPSREPAAVQAEAQLAVREEEAPVITLPPQATAAPTAEPTPRPTEAPTQAPTQAPTEAPTEAPTLQPQSTAFQYLPVVHAADIKAKRIAITVDDCYQVENLRTIVNAAQKVGGRLTLFPVGENLSKPGMPDLLKRAVFDLGFEIENHTWSHARVFRLSDEEMAGEIWKQDAGLDRALGVHYQEHFLRLMGGDGDTDPRIHAYLKQLGYLGIANWSVSGSDSDMKHIKAALAPGQVYLFHCTDKDTKKLEQFIPWAASQGYELVTLNALFGLAENETSALADSAMPQPEANVDDHHTLTEGEYTWVALQLQDRLRSMGYLDITGPSTGYYGPQTVKAVAKYQKDNGLPVTGEADAETQRRILES